MTRHIDTLQQISRGSAHRLLSLLLVLATTIGCGGKGGERPTPPTPPDPDEEITPTLPEWNPDRTITLLHLNRLEDSPLLTTEEDFTALGKQVAQLPERSYSLILATGLEEAVTSKPSMSLTRELKRHFGYHILHDYSSDGTTEGSLLITREWLSGATQQAFHGLSHLFTTSTTLTGTGPRALRFPIRLAICRISSREELLAWANTLPETTSKRSPHLCIVLLRRGFNTDFEALTKKVEGYSATAVAHEAGRAYLCYIFAPSSFVLRQVSTAFTTPQGIQGQRIDIETGVSVSSR